MKRRVKFITYGKPSIDDPTGAGATGTPSESVDAYLRDDGMLEVAPNYIVPSSEGTNPGQYQNLSSATQSDLLTLKNALRTLANDANADVATAASAIIAKLTHNGRRAVINTLLSAAINAANPVTRRVNAIQLIGMIVEDVV